MAFGLTNCNLNISITKDKPVIFKIPDFVIRIPELVFINDMSNSKISVDFYEKYVDNIDPGNVLVVEPMYAIIKENNYNYVYRITEQDNALYEKEYESISIEYLKLTDFWGFLKKNYSFLK